MPHCLNVTAKMLVGGCLSRIVLVNANVNGFIECFQSKKEVRVQNKPLFESSRSVIWEGGDE